MRRALSISETTTKSNIEKFRGSRTPGNTRDKFFKKYAQISRQRLAEVKEGVTEI